MRRFFDYDFDRLDLGLSSDFASSFLEGQNFFEAAFIPLTFAQAPNDEPLRMDDYPSDTSTMGVLTLGDYISGVFEDTGGSGDSDWARIELTTGQNIRIDGALTGTINGQNYAATTGVAIYDATGTFLDGLAPGFAHSGGFDFTVTQTGTYYLSASTVSVNNGDENWNLSVMLSGQDDFGDTIATAGAVVVGDPAVVGQINYNDGTTIDIDYFAVDVTAGQTIDFMSSTITARNPSIAVLDSNGVVLGQSNTGSNAYSDGVRLSFDTPQQVFLVVTSYISEDQGFYAVEAQELNQIDGTAGNDSLDGTSDNDVIYGLAGDDIINGLAGDDLIFAGPGADTIDGGDGDDTLSFEGETEGLTIFFQGVNNTTSVSTNSGTDEFTNIERIIGGDGDDRFFTSSSIFENVHFEGGGGDDLFRGGDGNDVFIGGEGDDFVIARRGYDLFDGGAGSDRLSTFSLGLSFNPTQAYSADLALGQVIDNGFGETVTLINVEGLSGGTFMADTFLGDANDNVIFGNLGGADLVDGRGGDDILALSSGTGTVIGGAGVDGFYLYGSRFIQGTFDQQEIFQGVEINLAAGTLLDGFNEGGGSISEIENFDGSFYSDTLIGDASDNIIRGFDGQDMIDGGAGIDTISYARATTAVNLDLNAGTGIQDVVKIEVLTAASLDSIFLTDALNGDMNITITSDAFPGGDAYGIIRGVESDVTDGSGVRTVIFSTFGLDSLQDAGLNNVSNSGTTSEVRLTMILDFSGNLTYTLDMSVLGLGVSDISQVILNSMNAPATVDVVADSNGAIFLGTETDTLLNFENLGGSAFDDVLTGDAGDNEIIGAQGDDAINGGLGSDTAVYSGDQSQYAVFDNGDGTYTVLDSTGVEGTDTLTNVEFLEFADGTVDLSTAPMAIYGTAGDDNPLDGTAGNDIIFGLAGNDVINGLGGADQIFGGAGDDNITGDVSDTILDGGRGYDTLTTSDIALLSSGTSNFEVFNITASGVVDASSAEGRVFFNSSIGNDTYTGSAFSDIFRLENGGTDTVDGGDGLDGANYILTDNPPLNMTITTATGVTSVDFGSGISTLTDIEYIVAGLINFANPSDITTIDASGADISVILFAASFNATLIGGSRDDTLDAGGLISDVLTGNGGADRFVVVDNTSTISAVNLGDTEITDFTALDSIDLIFNAAQNFTLTYSAVGFTNTAHQLTSSVGGGQTFVEYDEDGDGVADQTLTISNGEFTLVAEDISSYGLVLVLDEADQFLDGDAGDNIIEGGAGNDTLNGFAGDDNLIGGAGADALNGGDGNDFLRGGSGADSIFGGIGDDVLTGGSGDDTLDGGDGNDALLTGSGTDSLTLGAGDDYAFIDSNSIATVNSGLGTNVVESFSTQTTVSYGAELGDQFGQSRTITVDGTSVTDSLGLFNDTIFRVSIISVNTIGLNTALTFDATDFYGYGTVLNQSTSMSEDVAYGVEVYSGELNDNLTGSWGGDILVGGEGDDTLKGLFGDDNIQGGAGIDTVVYDGNRADYTISDIGGGLLAIIHNAGDDGTDTVSAVEFAQFADETIDLSTIGGPVFTEGDDVVDGTEGDDVLDALGGNDVVNGLGGNDTIFGRDGDDILDGGDGNDTLLGGTGADQLIGGNGFDAVSYTDATSAIALNLDTGGTLGDAAGDTYSGIERVYGSNFDDVITGSSGDDSLIGGLGADELNGSAGFDSVDYRGAAAGIALNLDTGGTLGDAAGDTFSSIERVYGSNFDDVITGSSSDDSLIGGLGADELHGGAGFDSVEYRTATSGVALNLETGGTSGDAAGDTFSSIERVYGSDFDDVITGSSNDDSLIGGMGADELHGGAGFDSVEYRTATSGVELDLETGGTLGDAAGDTFSSIERVYGSDFDDVIAGSSNDDTLVGEGGNDTLIGGAGINTLSGGNGDDILVLDAGNGLIFGDFDGGAGYDTLLINGDGITAANDQNDDIDARFINNDFSSLEEVEFAVDGDDNPRNFFIGSGEISANELSSTANIDGRGNGFFDRIQVHVTDGVSIDVSGWTFQDYTAGEDSVSLYGSEFSDTITGSSFADGLFGEAGDDILSGLDGSDIFIGGAGNDNLDGGEGVDLAVYVGDAADFVITNNGDGTYTVVDNTGASGTDTLINIENVQIGSTFIELSTIGSAINGTPGNDIPLNGTSDDDVINGLAGNDVIYGLAGNDTINGDDGADRLIGGEGADALNGGAGFDSADYRGAAAGVAFNVLTGGTAGEANGDTFSGIERYYLSNFNDVITGSDANEFFYGEDGNDVINGGGGVDRIYGGDGDDIQRGQDGNDTLYGSAGADQLNGGVGLDIASYDNAAAAVTVNLLTGGTVGDAAGDTYFGIEIVQGSDFDDTLIGNNGSNRLIGGLGADTLDGGLGFDSAFYTTATTGVTLSLATGGTGGDAAGDSFISIEWVYGSSFNDDITGDSGANRLYGLNGNDMLDGAGGNDRIFGGNGDDTITGGDGVDVLYGETGDDTMFGGAGNDFFFGGAGADSFDGGDDFDTVNYLAASQAVSLNMTTGGTAGEALGDSYISIERVFGSQQGDNITGDSGNNAIIGANGNDYLSGGGGADNLYGGAGSDSFGYDTTGDGQDFIRDFTTDELIYILGGDPAFDTWAELQAVAIDTGTNVIFDFGGGNRLIVLNQSLTTLDASNFDFGGTAPSAPPPAGQAPAEDDAVSGEIIDVLDMDALI